MSEDLVVQSMTTAELPGHAAKMKAAGCRLVQICATRLADGGFELTYSFAREPECLHARVTIPADKPEVPSISGAYWGAFAYENEIHDLFGIRVLGMNINYNGSFYKLSIPNPFAEPACVIPTSKKS